MPPVTVGDWWYWPSGVPGRSTVVWLVAAQALPPHPPAGQISSSPAALVANIVGPSYAGVDGTAAVAPVHAERGACTWRSRSRRRRTRRSRSRRAPRRCRHR